MQTARILNPLRTTLLRQPIVAPSQRTFSSTARNNLARLSLIGRLGLEPELTVTAGGKQLVKLVVAVNYGNADNRQTSWFRVASFGEGVKRDALLALPKGTLIHLEADARMKTYDDANGQKATSLDVVERSFEVINRPRGNTTSGGESDMEAIEEEGRAASG